MGVASGKYDAAISYITVTKERKERFDFAACRADNHAFVVKKTSPISTINQPADIAGKRIIVGAFNIN